MRQEELTGGKRRWEETTGGKGRQENATEDNRRQEKTREEACVMLQLSDSHMRHLTDTGTQLQTHTAAKKCVFVYATISHIASLPACSPSSCFSFSFNPSAAHFIGFTSQSPPAVKLKQLADKQLTHSHTQSARYERQPSVPGQTPLQCVQFGRTSSANWGALALFVCPTLRVELLLWTTAPVAVLLHCDCWQQDEHVPA